MKDALTGFQIMVSVFLIGAILLQARGTGLGSAWGGSSSSYQSRRGVEKILFTTTIALSVVFFIIQVAILI